MSFLLSTKNKLLAKVKFLWTYDYQSLQLKGTTNFLAYYFQKYLCRILTHIELVSLDLKPNDHPTKMWCAKIVMNISMRTTSLCNNYWTFLVSCSTTTDDLFTVRLRSKDSLSVYWNLFCVILYQLCNQKLQK